jgi:hypothetical protein
LPQTGSAALAVGRAPGVDFLNQLGLNPDVNVRGFPFHVNGLDAVGHARLIIPAKN